MANIDNNYLMENREQQILSEMTSLIESIKSQLAVLEEKLAQIVRNPMEDFVQDEEDMVPIDLEIIEDEDVVETSAGEPVEVEESVEAVTEIDAPVDEPVEVEEPVEIEELVEDEAEEPIVFEDRVTVEEPVEELVEVEESVEVEDIPEDIFEDEEPSEETKAEEPAEVDDDLPFFDEEAVEEKVPVLPVAEEPKAESRQAVIDAMAAKQAWRTDMPGLAVKDIRSAISLNDRLIFINYLFNEDPMAFQDVLTRINASQSLDEVVGMLAETHPEWDFESEVVYRFMMAVRRKIR